jgi:hypothetical protein
MMKAARTSETLVNFHQTTQRYSPEEATFMTLLIHLSLKKRACPHTCHSLLYTSKDHLPARIHLGDLGSEFPKEFDKGYNLPKDRGSTHQGVYSHTVLVLKQTN